MLYQTEHDQEQLQSFAKDCILSGRAIPDFIQNAPELLPGLEFYLTAFFELSSCRQLGMGVGPIPWTAIQKWGKLNIESDNDLRDLHFHLRRMDAAYLDWVSKNTKEKPNDDRTH